MSHKIRTVAGIALLIMAVIGALLPFVQGWIFFAAAVAVMGTDHVIIKWCFRQMERGKQLAQRFWRRKKDASPEA